MTDSLVPQGPPGIVHDRPTLIPAEQAPRFLWGDARAGFVSDWIHGSSPQIHMMSFEMRPGQRFGNSPDFKTFYKASETYYCIKGEFTFHCPETGEVHVLRTGDTLHFPPDTWHWGYNFGAETCRILESLTPRTEEALEAYAVRQPTLEDVRYGPLPEIGSFLNGGPRGTQRATVTRAGEYLYEIIGAERPMRVGLVCATAMLTTAIVDLHPGQQSEVLTRPSDQVLYCLDGRMNVHLPGHAPNWWELGPNDSAFLPGSCRHAFFNTSDGMARFLFSTVPGPV